MKIFLSYGSEDREIAREVAATLRASGHRVFFDRTELSPGDEFHAEIARQLQLSDAIIFLLSPSMLEAGRYPLSEIELAERRWPNPAHRVFPVVVRPIDKNLVPGYLRAVTIMTPSGPIAASIVQTMQSLQRHRSRYRLIIAVILFGFIILLSIPLGVDLSIMIGTNRNDNNFRYFLERAESYFDNNKYLDSCISHRAAHNAISLLEEPRNIYDTAISYYKDGKYYNCSITFQELSKYYKGQ
jgi:hypothetical protein